jgi:hypothetical protein
VTCRPPLSIGSAAITARDGAPTTGFYVLWYATDNPVLFAKMQQTGMPVAFLPRSDCTVEAGPVTCNLNWAIRGAGLRASCTQSAPSRRPPRPPSALSWYHDGPFGDLRITFHNEMRPVSTAAVTADFTRNEVLQPMLVSPAVITGVPSPYLRGTWTSELEYLN